MILKWLQKKSQLSYINAAKIDLNRFLDLLKSFNDIEISKIVAAATIAKIELNKLGKLNNNVFSISCDMVTQSQTLLFFSQLLKDLEDNKRFFGAFGMTVWIHTLRSFLYPELRLFGCQMWKELVKGFPFVEQTLIKIERENMPVPKEAYTEYNFIPIDLESFQ